MQKRLFLKNTLILTATALILRSIGILFRIYLSNAIGAEGMGIYQLIFSVYTLMGVLTSAGFNISVTKMVSASEGERRKIMTICFKLSLAISLIISSLAFLFADVIEAKSIQYPGAGDCIRILSGGLVFISLSACLKGYFIAVRKVSVPSNSQLFEQLVRMGIIFYGLSLVPKGDIYNSCIAVVIGNAISEVAAFAFLYIKYKKDTKNVFEEKKKTHLIKNLLYIFIPTTLSNYLNTMLHTYENLLVPDVLFRFYENRSIAVSLFGIVKGMAIPVVFFPASFLSAVSTMLLPEISMMDASSNERGINKTISFTIHSTILMSVFVGVIFFVCGEEISRLLYPNEPVGRFLKMFSVAIPFMYTESIIAGTLSALNLHIASLRFNIYNSIARISLILMVVPLYGIEAFVYIMIISNVFTSATNFIWLYKKTRFEISCSNFFLKPIFAASVAALGSESIAFGNRTFALLLKGGVAFLIYFAMIIILKSFNIKSLDFVKGRFLKK